MTQVTAIDAYWLGASEMADERKFTYASPTQLSWDLFSTL